MHHIHIQGGLQEKLWKKYFGEFFIHKFFLLGKITPHWNARLCHRTLKIYWNFLYKKWAVLKDMLKDIWFALDSTQLTHWDYNFDSSKYQKSDSNFDSNFSYSNSNPKIDWLISKPNWNHASLYHSEWKNILAVRSGPHHHHFQLIVQPLEPKSGPEWDILWRDIRT